MEKVLAAAVGIAVKTATHRWVSQQGFEPWVAHLISSVAGAYASTVVLRL